MLLEGVRMADVPNGARQAEQQQHSHKAGGGTISPHEKCTVGDRLYYQGHICSHARCAANNPHYNVKNALPPKKFLVAKKHAYGGLEEKGGEKTRTKSGSSTTTTSSDHHCDRNHALQSLTNSVLPMEPRKARSSLTNGVIAPANGKTKSNPMQHSRLTRDTSSSDRKKVSTERRGRPSSRLSNTVSSSSTTGRSSVTSESRRSEAHTSRLSNATSSPPSQATEQSSKLWESSTSPESSITSIRVTGNIISTRIGDEEIQQQYVAESPAAAHSPSASVGSNHDTEISSLKETTVTVVEQGEIVEQSNSSLGDLLYPRTDSEISSPSQNLHMDITHEFRSPPVDAELITISEFLYPSSKSRSIAPRTPERPIPTTTPVSEISSSAGEKSTENEEVNNDSSTPSVASTRAGTPEPLTSSVTSVKSGAIRSPTSNGRSTLTTPPQSSATRPTRKSAMNVSFGSSSPPNVSANRISRVPRSCETRTQPESAPLSTNASRLAKTSGTDWQARSVARKPSTKGVRSIELKGGKAQSYSTTTVTSWNVTTTTVKTTVSLSGGTSAKNVDSGLSASGPGEAAIEMPEHSSRQESEAATVDSTVSTFDSQPPNEAPAMVASVRNVKNVKTLEGMQSESQTVSLKFVKNPKSFEEVHAERETVHLKHGEVAERRLSEEYLTNHALEKKISDKDHRVKVLVHAFETLATNSEAELSDCEDGALNAQLGHLSSSATAVAV